MEALLEGLGESVWRDLLRQETATPYFAALAERVAQDRRNGAVYPPSGLTWTALTETPFSATRVVILGQDPYPGPRQAHGLAFSVARGVPTPRSLQVIFDELQTDVDGFMPPGHGHLQSWAQQGVLLLNTRLTVQHGRPNSHASIGWERLTGAIIAAISEGKARGDVVFVLWGGSAQGAGRSYIDRAKHHVLEAAHPAYAVGARVPFRGCRHFSRANAILRSRGLPPVDWLLPI